jgi:hypothetical protein
MVKLPETVTSERLYSDGRLGREATKSRRERTFYVSGDALRAVCAYVNTTRRAAGTAGTGARPIRAFGPTVRGRYANAEVPPEQVQR